MRPKLCEFMIEPERVRNPLRVTASRTSSFVKRPVANSSKALVTSAARSGSGIRLLPVHFGGVEIADGRNEHPAALFERHSHSLARSLGSHVVVELGEGGEHAFHQ